MCRGYNNFWRQSGAPRLSDDKSGSVLILLSMLSGSHPKCMKRQPSASKSCLFVLTGRTVTDTVHRCEAVRSLTSARGSHVVGAGGVDGAQQTLGEEAANAVRVASCDDADDLSGCAGEGEALDVGGDEVDEAVRHSDSAGREDSSTDTEARLYMSTIRRELRHGKLDYE